MTQEPAFAFPIHTSPGTAVAAETTDGHDAMARNEHGNGIGFAGLTHCLGGAGQECGEGTIGLRLPPGDAQQHPPYLLLERRALGREGDLRQQGKINGICGEVGIQHLPHDTRKGREFGPIGIGKIENPGIGDVQHQRPEGRVIAPQRAQGA